MDTIRGKGTKERTHSICFMWRFCFCLKSVSPVTQDGFEVAEQQITQNSSTSFLTLLSAVIITLPQYFYMSLHMSMFAYTNVYVCWMYMHMEIIDYHQISFLIHFPKLIFLIKLIYTFSLVCICVSSDMPQCVLESQNNFQKFGPLLPSCLRS